MSEHTTTASDEREGDVIGVCAQPKCIAPTLNRDECEVHKPRPWAPRCPVCRDLACDEHRP